MTQMLQVSEKYQVAYSFVSYHVMILLPQYFCDTYNLHATFCEIFSVTTYVILIVIAKFTFLLSLYKRLLKCHFAWPWIQKKGWKSLENEPNPPFWKLDPPSWIAPIPVWDTHMGPFAICITISLTPNLLLWKKERCVCEEWFMKEGKSAENE